MKKNIFFAAMLAFTSLGLSSCGDKDTEGLSRFTYYAILELTGEEKMTLDLGQEFVDPGCKATMAGQDVSNQVVTIGSVDTSKSGFYTLNYSVTNPDGFSASASRTVGVVDKNHFASAYWGESQYGSRHFYMSPITIKDRGDGTYLINDVLGGFYGYGRYPQYLGTSYNFLASGVLKLNDDNTISLLETGNWYFGQYPITLPAGNGTYNPTTGEIVMNLDFDGDPFFVKLTK